MATWNFVETALYRAVPGSGNSGYLTYDIGPALALPSYAAHAGSLGVSDRALDQGLSFDISMNAFSFSTIVPGSDVDFAFNVPGGVTTGFPAPCCQLGTAAHLALEFPAGLVSGIVNLASWFDDLIMPIDSNIVALGFAASGSEVLGCGNTQCFYSGYWEPVTHTPEPGFIGIALISAALIAVAATRFSVYRNRALQV